MKCCWTYHVVIDNNHFPENNIMMNAVVLFERHSLKFFVSSQAAQSDNDLSTEPFTQLKTANTVLSKTPKPTTESTCNKLLQEATDFE